jgi:Ca-activated chloride channel family protein
MSLALRAIAAVLLFSLPAIAAPQQQEAAPIEPPPLATNAPSIPTLRIDARLVSVALNVTDEHGAPVPHLTESDFELTEDNRPQRIAFFDSEQTTPLDIVLAVDASESLFPDDRLERDAARSFVASLLRPQDRIDLIAFSDNVDELVPFTNDPRRIDRGLDRIHPGDATALYDAIDLASQRLAGLQGVGTPSANAARSVVVLLTDGENTTRHGTYASALEAAERAGTMIYALILVPVEADAGRNTGGEHALIQLATDTGGKSYDVAQPSDLAPAMQHASADLRTQYTLGYYAPQHAAASSPLRHIHLQLKDPALRARYTLRYRTAYYASPQP